LHTCRFGRALVRNHDGASGDAPRRKLKEYFRAVPAVDGLNPEPFPDDPDIPVKIGTGKGQVKGQRTVGHGQWQSAKHFPVAGMSGEKDYAPVLFMKTPDQFRVYECEPLLHLLFTDSQALERFNPYVAKMAVKVFGDVIDLGTRFFRERTGKVVKHHAPSVSQHPGKDQAGHIGKKVQYTDGKQR